MKFTYITFFVLFAMAGLGVGLYPNDHGVKDCCINKSQMNCSATSNVSANQAIKAVKVMQSTCPLTDEPINKSYYADVKGKRIYVCCPACLSAVKKDPDKYLKMYADKGVSLEDIPAAPAKKKPAKKSHH